MSRRRAPTCTVQPCHLCGRRGKAEIAGARAEEAGFSLLELLIVVTILSILTLSVGLSINVGERGTRPDAERLVRLDAERRDTALFRRQTVGVEVTETGVQPLSIGSAGWIPTGAPLLWRDQAVWTGTGTRGGVDVISYLPDGRNTPFTATFSAAGRPVTCTSDGWSPVQCDTR